MTWKMICCIGHMAMQKEVLTRLDDGDQKVQHGWQKCDHLNVHAAHQGFLILGNCQFLNSLLMPLLLLLLASMFIQSRAEMFWWNQRPPPPHSYDFEPLSITWTSSPPCAKMVTKLFVTSPVSRFGQRCKCRHHQHRHHFLTIIIMFIMKSHPTSDFGKGERSNK